MARKPDFPKGWGDDVGSLMEPSEATKKRREELKRRTPPAGLPLQSRFTPERQDKIIKALRIGATYKIAAGYAGITQRTLNNWIGFGTDDPEGPYGEFALRVREAEGSAAVGNLAKIEKASQDGDWRAAAWMLERRHPDSYGKTVTEANINVKAAVAAIDYKALGQLSKEQLKALAGNMTEPDEDDDL